MIEKKIWGCTLRRSVGFRRRKGHRNAENNIGTKFEHSWSIMSVLHRVAEGIWPPKLDKIDADPKEHRCRLAPRKIDQRIYVDQGVKVRLDQQESRSVNTERGVRQRCCLSPILFNFHSRIPYQGISWRFWRLQNRTGNSHCDISRWTCAIR